jgi:hypothetical protein
MWTEVMVWKCHGEVEQRRAATGEVPGKSCGWQGALPGANDELP